MIDVRNIEEEHTLENYARYPELTEAVRKFESNVAQAARHLKGRTVWTVNSTAHGGGVAEMLPMIVSLSRQLGVNTQWAVIAPEDERFFAVTKRLHNLLHGAGEPGPRRSCSLRVRQPTPGRRVPLVGGI
jgi:trehalose synthase